MPTNQFILRMTCLNSIIVRLERSAQLQGTKWNQNALHMTVSVCMYFAPSPLSSDASDAQCTGLLGAHTACKGWWARAWWMTKATIMNDELMTGDSSVSLIVRWLMSRPKDAKFVSTIDVQVCAQMSFHPPETNGSTSHQELHLELASTEALNGVLTCWQLSIGICRSKHSEGVQQMRCALLEQFNWFHWEIESSSRCCSITAHETTPLGLEIKPSAPPRASVDGKRHDRNIYKSFLWLKQRLFAARLLTHGRWRYAHTPPLR